MTFQEFLIEGVVGHYARHNLVGTAYALLTGGAILLCMLTYLVGSLNFSIIISKRYHNDDIRNYGSGNAGTTNMLRTYGRRAAVLTLTGDALKAIVSTLFGYTLLGFTGAYVAGFFCILGHCFPIWYKFKGGKGFLVYMSAIWFMDWRCGVVALAIMMILLFTTKYMSLSTVCAMLSCPVTLLIVRAPIAVICLCAACVLFIAWRHRENFKRLIRGTESKFSLKSKKAS
jgi:glycerol-3-phosphate acyltransferase PlsY